MTAPTKIILRHANNPHRGTHWRLVPYTSKPLYCRRGEMYHTLEQLQELARERGYRLVYKYEQMP